MKALAKSFVYAWQGFLYCLRNERNMRIHFVTMLYMYSFLFLFDFFSLTKVEISIIFLANTIVFMGELINTAIESTINLVEKKYHALAKTAKDTAAAAVLVGAIFSVAIGVTILWQPEAFREMIEYYRTHVFMLIAFIISVVICIFFVFKETNGEKKKESINRKGKIK